MLGPAGPGEGAVRPIARVISYDLGKGSLCCDTSELVGPELLLFRRDTRTAEQELRTALASLRRRLDGRRPQAVIYFTAAGRLARLEAAGVPELDLVLDRLDRPPIVGLASDAVIIDDQTELQASVAAVLA